MSLPAPTWLRRRLLELAALRFESGGRTREAAECWMEQREFEKASSLFRVAGDDIRAAAALINARSYLEALKLLKSTESRLLSHDFATLAENLLAQAECHRLGSEALSPGALPLTSRDASRLLRRVRDLLIRAPVEDTAGRNLRCWIALANYGRAIDRYDLAQEGYERALETADKARLPTENIIQGYLDYLRTRGDRLLTSYLEDRLASSPQAVQDKPAKLEASYAGQRIAIISDIHSNLEALQAVLADFEQHRIDEVYCLGDMVGYGPNPRECLDLVMAHSKMCLLGDHDQAVLFDPEGFDPSAERAIFWTRQQLETGDPKRNETRWEFVGERPRMFRNGNMLFVHGSARNPLNEFVFPEDIYNQRKMEKIFQLVEQYCFQGHTHIPGVITEGLDFFSPEELNFKYTLGAEKVLVNPGSVGFPAHGSPDASYVILEGHTIEFRRVSYDYERTIQKIYEIPELDNSIGDALRNGQGLMQHSE